MNHPRDRCVHELFEEQVARTPEAVAVVFGDQQLTYRELNECANQLAHHLRMLGVEPETLVGLFMERSLELVVGLLGILKAGGAYVPMDPQYPQERLAFMQKDAQTPVVVTQKSLAKKLSAASKKLVCLDDDWPDISRELKTNPTSDSQPDNLAYVIYTSGSTGTPKGSLLSHHNVVRLFQATHAWFQFDEKDVWTLFHSCAFDFSVWELWGALFYGGRLVVVPFHVSRTPDVFYRLLCDEGVTVLNQTPSAFQQLIQAEAEAGISPKLALRLVIFGGEALDFKSLKPWFDLHSDQSPRLVNMYGITETTVHVTYRPISAADLKGGSMIGVSIPDLKIYLLDGQKLLVPIGMAGELYIGGDGLARGYLNRPELTAEKFIADPFSTEPVSRLYKTGDLARYLPDGNIEFLGRLDQQVKLRGFRIELGEIESVLATHPKVAQAAVIAREDVPGNKTLAAYLIVREPAPSLAELRDFLLARLPDYMVPAAFVPLAKLPLTPNGKLDRHALPAPGHNRLGSAAQPVAPQTPTQIALAQIWADLINIPSPGIHDNFFALGGHSLMAVKMVFQIRETFKSDLPVRMIFEFPTLAGLARVVDGETFESDSPLRLMRMDRSSADGKFAASYGQEQLWFLDQLDPDSSVYNVPLVIRLQGQLNQAALAQSLNHLVQRHEVLRTTFLAENGVPRQVVAPHLDLKLTVVDLEKIPAAGREAKLSEQLLTAAGRPFDLSRGPLLRAELFYLSPTEQVLLLTVHHIVFDGWSVEVLLRELTAIYPAFCAGHPPGLPELPVQYVDFAAWQRHYLTAEKVEQHLGYWRRQLAGVPTVFELPAAQPRPRAATHAGAHQPFILPPELTTALRWLAHAEGTTLFVTLLAAFQTLLYRFSGQQQILVGSPLSGRMLAECEELIGFFVNVLPLKADFSNHPSFTELLQQLHHAVWEAQDHQELPFERLVQALHPQRDLGRNPIFQIALVFESESSPLNPLGREKVASERLKAPMVKFDLTFLLTEKNGSLHGFFEYATQIFDPADISRLLAGYQNLLAAIVADAAQPDVAAAAPVTSRASPLAGGMEPDVQRLPA